MILGSAIVPIWVILMLLILRSPNGVIKGTAFVAGATLVRALQGLAFGYLFGTSDHVGEASTGSSPVIGALLLVLGILLLVTAFKTYRNEPDPDAPPPKWMTMMDGASTVKIFGLGAILTIAAAKMWVFTLSAIGTIKDATLGNTESIAAFVIYVLAAESLLLLPLLMCIVVPKRSQNLLKQASDWLEAYNRPITIAVSLIFGALFTWKGVTVLLP
jgi:hypothetical protein